MPISDRFKNGIAVGTISNFGGCADREDNGATRCGDRTCSYNPETSSGPGQDYSNQPYCALPSSVWANLNVQCGQIIGFVNIENGNSASAPLWDLGPSESLGRVADVSPGIMAQLGGNGLLSNVQVSLNAGTQPVSTGPNPSNPANPVTPSTGSSAPSAEPCVQAAIAQLNTCLQNAPAFGSSNYVQYLNNCQSQYNEADAACYKGVDCASCGITNIPACLGCIGEYLTHGLEIVSVNIGLALLVFLGIYLLFFNEINAAVKTAANSASEIAEGAAVA